MIGFRIEMSKRKRDSGSGHRSVASYFSKKSDNGDEDEGDIGASGSNETQSQQSKHHALIDLTLDQVQTENGNWTLFFHFNIHFAGSTSSCRIGGEVNVDDVLLSSTINPGASTQSDSDSDDGNESAANGKMHSFISSYIQIINNDSR